MVRAKSLDGEANPTVLSKDAFQEMIDWENKMYNVTIFDDALVTDENVFTYGGEGKIIGLKDMCKEFNLTVDEDQEKVGPTDPVPLEPKVSLLARSKQILIPYFLLVFCHAAAPRLHLREV